jgi:RHS repeat-associated protein
VSISLDAGQSLAYGLAGAAASAPTVSGSTVTYPGVLAATDLRLESLASGLKESLLLHSAQAPTTWVFPLHLSGLTARMTSDGTVEFVDAHGMVVGRVPRAYMHDAAFSPRSGGNAMSTAITYALTTVAGAPALRLTADAAWVHDPSRVFPITVDPSYAETAYGTATVRSDEIVDFSGLSVMEIGTPDNGGQISHALISFADFTTNLPGAPQITSAQLNVFDTGASTCSAARFDVAPITSSWSVTGYQTWPAPSAGGSIGNLTANPGAACTNTSGDSTVGVWMDVPLSTGTFNSWSAGGTNFGLMLYGSSSGYDTWKQFDTINTVNPPQLILNYTPNQPPQIDMMYPPNNFTAQSLTPELSVMGHDPDGWPSPITYQFTVYSSTGTQKAQSAYTSSTSYVVPAGKLSWGSTYFWSVSAYDGAAYSQTLSTNEFTTTVPQPLVTSGLSQNTGEHGFDPAVGNYTTAVSDAQVQTVGPTLSVQRSYNSLDPRTSQAFGAGWSSVYDMRATEVHDPSSGALTGVIITYPTGQDIEFGKNPSGVTPAFASPQGRYSTLTAVSNPTGYQLVDKSATNYTFTQTTSTSGAYAIASIADAQGRSESFTYNAQGQLVTATSMASQRALHISWTTPSSPAVSHVQTVVTDPVTPGNSATALTWTYGYSGDQLTSVCPPGTTTMCTGYAYTGGSHFRTTVMDAGPRGYWRMADLPTGTTASDQILTNEGSLNATYASQNMLAGVAGPLANGLGSASFDGSTTWMRLKDNLFTSTTYLSVGLWFKTTSTSTGTLLSTGHSTPGTSNPSGAAMPVLYVGSDGRLYGHFWNLTVPGISSSVTVNDGHWHYVVLTGAGNTQSLYLDGAQVGQALTGQITNVDPYEMIGTGVYNNDGWPAAPSGNSWNYFAGNIAEVALYPRPLPASTILAQWTAATTPANLLTTITRPSGKTDTTVAYHGFDDGVTSVTDINGGTWGIGAPWVTGSSQTYVGAVLGSGPMDYWRFGETGASQAVNQVHGGTATYNTVALGASGLFGTGSGADTAASFNGTSSYVSLPTNIFPSGASSQELWFNTTATGRVLLSSQASAAGSTTCPCLPVMWITPDGKLRAQSPSTSPNGPFTAVQMAHKCIDLYTGNSANGTKVQVWDCLNGDTNQNWTLYPDGTVRTSGKCLDATGNGTSNGTLLELWDCNGGANQVWQPYNGGLRNPVSGRCLDDPTSSTANGTQFQLYDCNGTNAQQWTQSLVTSKTVNDGTWHHAVLTTDGKSQSLYLDGALAHSTAQSTTGTVPLTPGGLAYAYSGTGYTGTTATGLPANTTTYFSGTVEELAAYASNLSAADVARHYSAYKSVNGIAPVQTVQVSDPGSTQTVVAASFPATFNASANQTWSVPGARLVFQSDGNLVVYRTDTGQQVWSTNTGNHPSAVLAFQSDGSVVVYTDSTLTTGLWWSGTGGHPGATAMLQPNGVFVIDDSAGRPLWASNPPVPTAPHVLTYAFDPLNGGRPLSTIDALGQKTGYGYDTQGFLHTVTDPNGNVTTTGHDLRGNMVSKTTCQNQATMACSTTYYTYYPDDTNATPPADQRNDLLVTQADGRSSSASDTRYVTRYAYDSAGNRTSVITPPLPGYPSGRTSTTVFTSSSTPAADSGNTPAGLVASTQTPGGATETVTYFHNGDPATVIDPTGTQTSYTYDGLGRVLTRTVVSNSFPNGLTTSYTYDGENRPLTITEPSVTNRVTGAIHTARTTDVYDADGDTLSTTVADLTGGDASRTVSNTFDSSDRVQTASDAWGKTTSYTYDVYGNRVSETDPANHTTAYTYDANQNLLTTTLRAYTGDPVNPSPAVDLVESARSYDPAGRLAEITDSMGWVTTYTYYDNGLTATITRSDPTHNQTFVQQSNTYDAAGNLISRVTNNGATTTNYTVDAASRTTAATLDPAGLNRMTSYSYSPDDFVLSTRISDGSGNTAAATDTGVDALGRTTSTTVHDDTTGHPVGWWRLSDGSGTIAADSSGLGQTGVLSATGATLGSGAVLLNGSSGAITPGAPVLNTAASYTVSAWVNLNNLSTYQTVVSQDGNQASSFFLQYRLVDNRWSFTILDGDSTSAAQHRAESTAAPTTGTWTHLVGVLDATAKTATLYVNGTANATTTVVSPFNATGPFAIGRARAGASTDWVNGSITDVQVYNRALSATEVTTLYGNGRTGGALDTTLLTTTRTLDQRGLPTAVTDPAGNTTTYAYDEAGHQAVVSEPATPTESNHGTGGPGFGSPPPVTVHPTTMFGYDTFGEQVETSDPNGNVTTMVYGPDGRLVSTQLPSYTPPGGTTITAVSHTAYTVLGQVATSIDAVGDQTSYVYDQLGDVATVTDPNGGVTHYTYDTNGDRLTSTDPSGGQTQATYDYLGRMLTSTAVVRQTSASYTTTYGFNAAGFRSSMVSPAGVSTGYAFNAAGEPTQLTDGAGNTTTMRYDALGRVVATVPPDKTSATVTYDQAGRQTGTADLDATGAVLRTTSVSYDADGQPLASTDPNGATSTFTYTPTGWLAGETQPVTTSSSIVTSFGYDAAGNRTRFTDGRGNPFITTYNSWNLPESSIEPATPAFPNAVDRTFTVSYDADGRVTEQTSPGGVSITDTYDSRGNLTGQTGTGAEAATVAHSYGYDAANRVTSLAGSGTTNDTVAYDDRGLPTSVGGPSGTSSFSYTSDGSMASRTDASGTSNYTYDTAGRLSTVADAASGATLAYGYNVMNQVASIGYGPPCSSLCPYVGPLHASRSFTYNSLHQLTGDTLTNPSAATEASITYGYDLAGNETSKTTTGVSGASTNTYTYDQAGRITSWNNGTTTLGYGYDGSGNRISVGSRTFTYDARNELTSDTTSTYPYTYTYTSRGTLASTTVNGSTTTGSSDAFNRVITEGAESYTYDGADRVLTRPGFAFTYSGLGNTPAGDGTATYSRDPGGQLIGVAHSGTGDLVLTDQHTDVVANFTASGAALAGSATYAPFGSVLSSTAMVGNLGYQSGWTDPTTAKVNMASRWYNPAVGQFTSRDTVGNAAAPNSASANRFAYVDDNPLVNTDPTGHCGWFDISCAVSSIGNAVSNVVNTVQQVATNTWNTVSSAATAATTWVANTAGQFYSAASQWVGNAWNTATHWVTTALSAISDAWTNVRNWVGNTVRNGVTWIKHAATTVWKAAVYTYNHPVQALAAAAQATGTFLKAHAADVASFIVSTAVFVGCEAATGAPTAGVGAVASQVGCSALAGAVGSAVTYGMTTPINKWNLGDAAKAIGAGAAMGAAGGALGMVGGKLIATFGSKILGPALDSVASRLGPAALDDAASTVADETANIADETASTAANDATHATSEPHGGGGGGESEPHGGGESEPHSGTESDGSSCAVPHSFDPATPVLMANGTTKPIGTIALGDKVESTDPATGKTTTEPVVALHDNHDTDLADVTIRTSDGKTTTLHTTWHHPFWNDTDHTWTDAAQLKPGKALHVLTTPGRTYAAKVIAVKTWTGLHDMRDLTVADVHTYYVIAGTISVLVHNCGTTILGYREDIEAYASAHPNDDLNILKLKGTANGGRSGFGKWTWNKNVRFIKAALDRGDRILLVSDPQAALAAAAQSYGGRRVYQNELAYLQKRLYLSFTEDGPGLWTVTRPR